MLEDINELFNIFYSINFDVLNNKLRKRKYKKYEFEHLSFWLRLNFVLIIDITMSVRILVTELIRYLNQILMTNDFNPFLYLPSKKGL